MKLDLKKTGLDMIFKEYEQIIALEFFKKEKSSVFKGGESGSGNVWKYCSAELLKRGHGTISRASVIFCLNRMVNEGILFFKYGTGKGGHHKIYCTLLNLDQFWCFVMKRAFLKLIDASGDPDLMKKTFDA